jgi:hypothetical protein
MHITRAVLPSSKAVFLKSLLGLLALLPISRLQELDAE